VATKLTNQWTITYVHFKNKMGVQGLVLELHPPTMEFCKDFLRFQKRTLPALRRSTPLEGCNNKQ